MSTKTPHEILSAAFASEKFLPNYPLAEHTYFKIGGPAEVFFATKDKTTLARVIGFCYQNNISVTILGGGSNVVVSDAGVRGLVCSFTGDTVSQDGQKKNTVYAEAGCKTALLVAKTVSFGLTGLEYFLGVPGTLGGAIYNNAHYLNQLIGEYITRVEIITHAGTLQWLSQKECLFGYDTSRFHKTKEVIVSAEFLLKPGNKDSSHQKIKEATEYRAQTQPLGTPSSGCIFKNTPNTPNLRKLFPQFADQTHVSGGFLIDQAGLKGYGVGGVEVSSKHAAWIINPESKGTQKDVSALVKVIKASVKEKFGVELQEEIVYLK